ncbi:MAG: MurR/RpiR family transcriptional regulator [Burkholderiaceae bacterium]|nr:MurR/RpiR family transcriptional regulator [Burkholderiaceae bacterium]MCD8566163.1 MurR/RpiR family transcriptional regulator [Burkholderiaceae bacterium]
MRSASQPVIHSLDELKQLIIDIGRGQASISLGSKTLQVLAALVENPNQVALHSISEVAKAVGVNASTLTRLASRLGFGGYGEFQAVFKRNLTNSSAPFYSEQGKRLLQTPRTVSAGANRHVLDSIAADSIRNIEAAIAATDPKTMLQAAARIARARRVVIYGLRQFHAIASYLVYGLNLIRPDVSLLDANAMGVAEGLSQLGSQDILIVASVAPYTRLVAEVAKTAHDNGIQVVALSDSLASPLVTHAQYPFLIPHTGSYISNSLGAYLVFCEGLVNLVAKELGAAGLKTIKQRERLIEQLKIEMG